MPSLTELAAFLGGPVGIGLGVFARDYLKRRQEAAIAAESARTETERAKVAAGAAERVDVVTLLREQIAAGEQRAERSAARAEAMVEALRAEAAELRSLADAVDELRAAVTAHATREEGELATLNGRVSAILSLAPQPPAGGTGEHARASVIPEPPRLPTPSALRPVTPPLPPRRPT